MKKLFNSKFLFILASSLVVLIGLVIGSFYLFDDVDDSFVKSGYVLNPLSSTAEKYFFDENAGYRENLSSMIEFVDVDENKVAVLKDSFVHYMDESMSFLTNGAILDLDSLVSDKAVSFYNISNKSIIEKKDNGYVIESSSGDVKLNNFIGRISDDKYIIVGDLSLKMVGNSTNIKGDYFEVVYVEEGIVNIENKSVKYQVAADETLIYVGNDKVIDLGDKKITVNGQDLMSITAITINGDENIEIIPKAEEEDDEGGSGEDDNTGNENTGIGENLGTGNEGENQGGTGDTVVDGEKIEEVVVSLKDADIGSTNVNVIFDVLNAKDDDLFKLQVVNLDSGKTVDMVAQVLPDALIQVNLLTPNTKYLFMVINEKDNGKYFQKVFETTSFGIKLEKAYATEDSLAYKISIEEGTDITNAKLTLYKFNEETMQNEVVTSSYTDPNTGEIVVKEKITNLSNFSGNLEGVHEIVFDGLDNNTIYTAVLDEFSLASSNFKDIYNITNTSMTLKKTPLFSEMTVTKDVGEGSFDLSLGNITDPDSAIVSYTYMIYDRFTNELAVEPIIHSNASPITVLIGDDKNQLKSDTNYYYKAIIEYYDNEKYIEYVTSDSIIFNMGSDPYITVVSNKDLINYNQIGATIYLRDNSCLISIPGREKCSGNSTTIVEVSRVNAITGEKIPVYTKAVVFEVNGREIKYELVVDGLEPGTTYSVDVRANFNNADALQRQEILHTDESNRFISTKSFTTFTVEWGNVVGYEERPLNATTHLVGDENTGTLSPDESAASMETVILKLYDGRNIVDIDKAIPIATATFNNTESFNLKEKFYDRDFDISNDETFGLTAEQLKARSEDGELSEYYTIVMEVYAVGGNEISLVNNKFSYRVAPGLFNEAETILEVSTITNSSVKGMFENLTNDGTIVGYNVYAYYDRATMVASGMNPMTVNFYVYDEKKKRLDFLVVNEDGELEQVDKYSANVANSADNFYELPIYMDYGSSYQTQDEVMRRGNSFYVGYEIVVGISGNETSLYPLDEGGNSPTGYGMYKFMTNYKETPSLKMYIANSTASSITYNYVLRDPDNSVYRESDTDDYGFYYIIGNGIEKKSVMNQNNEDYDYNVFEGSLTLDGMKNGEKYSLYFKMNTIKTGVLEDDVSNYLDGTSGKRVFDGYYDLVADTRLYNFNYQIINDPLKDNKVVIKILAKDEILDRILSYRLNFKTIGDDGKEIVLNKELWKLSKCNGSRDGELDRCLSVDYIELANAGMKSDVDKVKPISVEVIAIYDNGLQGYDFKVEGKEDDDYVYCIMQGNSNEEGLGSYISFSKTGNNLAAWSEEIDAPKGYYTYVFNERTNQITYTSKLDNAFQTKFRVNLTGGGYYYSNASNNITPKMVSVDNMGCYGGSVSDCNVFSFNSVTPTIDVNTSTSLINGAVIDLQLFGIDINDIKKESDGERYLYVETWDSKTAAVDNKFDKVVRPTYKVKINSNNPTEKVRAIIDGLKELKNGSNVEATGTYYFNVYAYMNDGSNTYRQLYDEDSDGYEVVTYTFNSVRVGDLYHSSDINFTASDVVYGERTLNTKINLLAYKNSTAYNFDIIYVLCDIKDANNCSTENNIFKRVIPLDSLSTSISDSINISEFADEYNLEYGKSYLLSVYARTDYYDSENGNQLTKRDILINPYNRNVTLRSLSEPSFVVTRNAILENNDYGIDFNIIVNDLDRTLLNGNYYIKLIDSTGAIQGNMMLLDDSGNYYDVSNYSDYAFDAFEVNKRIRIMGLEPDTQYSFVVYGDAYLNNFDSKESSVGCNNGEILDENGDCVPKLDENGINQRKVVEVSKSYTVYSTNDYGVAFGIPTYTVTERSIVITFLGGSSFDNVSSVDYTVGLWDDEQSSSTTGTYVIGVNNKYFELFKNSDNWRFVIDPSGMKNVIGKTYNIIIKFKLRDPITGLEVDGPQFEDRVTYYEDEK